VGKPTAAVNPDEAELDEFRLIRERPSKAEAILALIDTALPGKLAEAFGLLDHAGETPQAYLEGLLKDRGSSTTAQVAAEQEAKIKRRK
jgi:hypothetical protein